MYYSQSQLIKTKPTYVHGDKFQQSAECRLPVSPFYHFYCHWEACCGVHGFCLCFCFLLGGEPSLTICGVRCALSGVGLCPPSFSQATTWLAHVNPWLAGAAHDWSHTSHRTKTPSECAFMLLYCTLLRFLLTSPTADHQSAAKLVTFLLLQVPHVGDQGGCYAASLVLYE